MRTVFQRAMSLLLALLTVVTMLPMMPVAATADDTTKAIKIDIPNNNLPKKVYSGLSGETSVSVAGTVSSQYTIKSVKMRILNVLGDGSTRELYKYENSSINATSFSLSAADSALKFSRLSRFIGAYIYEIVVDADPGENADKATKQACHYEWQYPFVIKNADGLIIKLFHNDETGKETHLLTTSQKTLVLPGLTREGYTFMGWGTSANDTKAAYLAGTELMPTEALSLYAVWSNGEKAVKTNVVSYSGLGPYSFAPAQTYADVAQIVMDYYNIVTENGRYEAFWNAGIGRIEDVGTPHISAVPFLDTITRKGCGFGKGHVYRSGLTECKSNYIREDFIGGDSQCEGFASYMTYVTMKDRAYVGTGGYTKIEGNALKNYKVKPGDVIRYNTHSVFVYAVTSGMIHYIECNNPSGSCRINLGSMNGIPKNTHYIHSSPITKEIETYDTNVAFSLTESANLYEKPDSNSNPVTTLKLPAGSKGIATRIKKNEWNRYWYYVSINGINGWIYGSYCGNLEAPQGIISVVKRTNLGRYKYKETSVDLAEELVAHGCTITEVKGSLLDMAGNVVKRNGSEQVQTITGLYSHFSVCNDKGSQKQTIDVKLSPRKLNVGVYRYVLDAKAQTYTTDGKQLSTLTFAEPIRVLDDQFEIYDQEATNVCVTLNANGGKCNKNEIMVKKRADIGELPVAERSNTVFSGWYTQKTGGKKVTEKSTFDKDTTLYAHWGEIEVNSFTVSYDANTTDKVSKMPDEQTKQKGKTLTLSKNVPTRTGYTFQNWSDGKNTYKPGGSYKKDENVILKAQWKADTYTVKYDDNTMHIFSKITGTMADSSFSTQGNATLRKNAYVRTDRISGNQDLFLGWNTKSGGGGTSYGDGATVGALSTKTGDTVKLYAQWAEDSYRVVYHPNGATGPESRVVAECGENLTLKGAGAFTRSGYHMTGWNTNANGTGKTYKPGSTAKDLAASGASVTLYAQWEQDAYSISYQGNGGSGSMSATSIPVGGSGTISSCGFTRNGYTFTGWNTNANGSGVSYSPGKTVNGLSATNGAVVKLYAQWKANEYKVVYHANGGSGSMSSSSHKVDTAKNLSTNVFTRSGFTFIGWNTNANGSGTSYRNGQSVKNLSLKDQDSVNLYAQWMKGDGVIVVKFDANGGTGTMDNMLFYLDRSNTLPKNSFSRTHYRFTGWSLSPTGIKLSTNGMTIPAVANAAIAALLQEDTVTLYAKWTPRDTYTVKYDSNGGSGSMSNSSMYIGEPGALRKNTFTKTEKTGAWPFRKTVTRTFLEWNTKKDGSGISYMNGETVTDLTTTANGSVTLYAQWTGSKPYTVVYHYNDGSGGSVSTTMNRDKTYRIIPLTVGMEARKGYTFTGWNTKADGTGTSYSAHQEVKNLAEAGKTINLYAKWNTHTYTVSYNANGGTGSMGSTSCIYDKNQTLSGCAFARTGYTFTGWNTKANGTGKAYTNNGTIKNLSAADGGTVILYAQWRVQTAAEYLSQCTQYPSYLRVKTNCSGTEYMKTLPCSQSTHQESETVRALYQNEFMTVYGIYKNSGGNYWYKVKADVDGKEGYIYGPHATVAGNCSGAVSFSAYLTDYTFNKGSGRDILGSVSGTNYAPLVSVTGVLDDSDSATAAQTVKISSGFGNLKNTALNKNLKFGLLSRGKGTLTLTADLNNYYITGAQSIAQYATNPKQVIEFTVVDYYKVLFDKNTEDAVSQMPDTQTKRDGTDLTLSSKVPVRTGYSFQGWAKDKKAEKVDFQPGDVLKSDAETGNMTLYALWEINTYKIYYSANGGTGGPENGHEKIYGKDLTLSSVKPTREGFTFLGWAESETATAAQYQPGSKFTKNGDTILYAVWRQDYCTVTYDANGGTAAPASQTKKYGETLEIPMVLPKWEGYIFQGWGLSKTADYTQVKCYPGDKITMKENLVLYAIWVKIPTYTITYYASGGSNAPAAQEKQQNVPLTLSNQMPTRTGFTFLGWSDEAGSREIRYSAGDMYTANADITLYAVWKKDVEPGSTYTITYDANGGEGAPDPQTGTVGENLAVSQQFPTREGYYCMGWATTPNAIMPTVGGTYTGDEDITFYAVWRKNSSMDTTYTVTFDDNGGNNGPVSEMKISGQEMRLPAVIPQRAHYTFLGWAKNKDAVMPDFPVTEADTWCYSEDEDLTLYAVWERTSYIITYQPTYGTGYPEPQTKYDGEPLTLSTVIPTLEGYDFLGWGVNDDGHGVDYLPGGVLEKEENLDLYAIWKRAPLLIYDANAEEYWKIDIDIQTAGKADPFDTNGLYHIVITVDPSEQIRQLYAATEDQPELSIQNWYDDYCPSGKILGAELEIADGKLDFYISKGSYPIKIGRVNTSLNGLQVEKDEEIQLEVQQVVFCANGGTFSIGATELIYLESPSHPLIRIGPGFTVPVRDGYTQIGWATSGDAEQPIYNMDVQYENIDPDVTYLYAVWQEN